MRSRALGGFAGLLATALFLAHCSGSGRVADPAAAPQPDLGIFVLVVDGLPPSEVGELTANLSAFRGEATWYPESRSVFTAETIPNHVAMMTGVYPERSGIPTNNFWDRTGSPESRDLSDPSELAARAVALARPGVADAWYREPNPIDPEPAGRLPEALHATHENVGDLVVNARLGWRFSDPLPVSNPIPGNHGHVVTRHNTFMVGGGASFVRRGQVIEPSTADPSPLENLPEQSENVDIAPTVLWLLGRTGVQLLQGRILSEAFTASASPSSCGVL